MAGHPATLAPGLALAPALSQVSPFHANFHADHVTLGTLGLHRTPAPIPSLFPL